jgi:hypothetical protein
MRFHSAPRHVELSRNFGVVTTLQKQFDNLLFAWTEPNSLIHHSIPLTKISHRLRLDSERQNPFNIHSTQNANLRRNCL